MFPKRQTYLNDEIRGDLIAIFKITHGLLEFPMSSTFEHPTHKEIGRQAYKFHQHWCCTRSRQFAFIIRAVPFCNEQQTEIVNAPSVYLSRHSGSLNSPKRQIPQNKTNIYASIKFHSDNLTPLQSQQNCFSYGGGLTKFSSYRSVCCTLCGINGSDVIQIFDFPIKWFWRGSIIIHYKSA